MADFGVTKALRGIAKSKAKRIDLDAVDKVKQKSQQLEAEQAAEKQALLEAEAAGLEAEARAGESPQPLQQESELSSIQTRKEDIQELSRRGPPEGRGVVAPDVEPTPPARPAPSVRKQLLSVDVDEESAAIARASLKDFDLEQSYQFNYDTFETGDDLLAAIAQRAEARAGSIDEARRGKITHDELHQLARDLGTRSSVVKSVLERGSGGLVNAETVLAAREFLVASAARLRSLAVKIDKGMGSDMDRLKFRRQMLLHDEFQRELMGARAETGRALNAFGIPVGLEEDPTLLRQMMEISDTMFGKDTDSLAKMIAEMDSIEGVNKLTRKYTRSKLAGALQELYINGLLSWVRTHIINTMGSPLMMGMTVAERALAARMGTGVEPGEATAMLFGMMSGFRDAMKLGARAFREGESLDGILRYEGHTRRAISDQNLEVKSRFMASGMSERTAGFLGKVTDFIGATIRVPTERVMAPVDEFMKAIAWRGELAAVAFREARQQQRLNPNMTREEFNEAITEFMDAPPAQLEKMASDYSLYITFQTPLGGKMGKLQKLLGETPGAFVVAPFIRTPVNIYKAGIIERTPIGLLTNRERADAVFRGADADAAIARARMAMGTGLATMVGFLAADGRITGGGPSDPAMRDVLRAKNWQPYSFVWTDEEGRKHYQSYMRLEPLAYIIGAVADLVEIRQAIWGYQDIYLDEEKRSANIATQVVQAIANNTTSKTFLKGVFDLVEAWDDPGRYFQNYVENVALAAIPYSSFRRGINQLADPTVREAWTAMEKLKVNSGVPSYSIDAPPKLDIYGNKIDLGHIYALTPLPSSEEKYGRVIHEMIRLQESTGSAPIRRASKQGQEGVPLNAKEYYQLMYISRNEPIFGGGSRTFEQQLEYVMDSPAYLNDSDFGKAQRMRDVQTDADEKARKELGKRNPDVAKKAFARQQRKEMREEGIRF
jgi:hypothetical protein